MKLGYIFILGIFCLQSCKQAVSSTDSNTEKEAVKAEPIRPLAKFEPENNKVLFFIGQDLEAVGGLENYKDGYLDHIGTASGWTSYTALSVQDKMFAEGDEVALRGIWETDSWQDHYANIKMQVTDPDFKNMALAIGLSMVGDEEAIANGERDSLILKLGDFFKTIAPRPVFLRTGYEFDGYPWNHYEREPWIKAYKRVKDKLDAYGVTNVAYVWQSTGFVSTPEQLEAWYPGDEYVDWCGVSFFSRWREIEMIDFARSKKKPVFIAEASPTISDFKDKFDGNTKETVLSNPEQAKEAWELWFVPFFKTIHDNSDVIKAISYINCNWKSQALWKENPTFKRIDARIQTSPYITKKWKEEIEHPKYLQPSDSLFKKMRVE